MPPDHRGNLLVLGTDNVPLTFDITTAYSDPNGDALTYTVDMTGAPAWLSYNPVTGQFTGTPPVDNTGPTLSFPSLSTTATAGLSSSTVTFKITNPAPVAGDGSSLTTAGTPVVVALLANDSDSTAIRSP